ncbi:MAG TPA: hypothetical protein ENL04_00695, partial [Sulfuricurvum sp.]|nr:hypothetical protein [Sulfuricurvum sp.]
LEKEEEIYPGIELKFFNGHTQGQIIPHINYKGKTLVYMADLLPSTVHIPIPCVPHEGFELLLQLGRKKPEGCFVFTSNVDGQFQKAGFDSKKIVEAHGSIHHFQCSNDCVGDIWGAAGKSIPVDMKHFRAKAFPRCPHCGAIARPNILMFGDWHWNDSRYLEQSRRMIKWLDQITLSNAKLAVIEIGAGTALSTVRKKSETVADRFENTLIRINPCEDDIPDNVSGIGLAMGGVEGLRYIVG